MDKQPFDEFNPKLDTEADIRFYIGYLRSVRRFSKGRIISLLIVRGVEERKARFIVEMEFNTPELTSKQQEVRNLIRSFNKGPTDREDADYNWQLGLVSAAGGAAIWLFFDLPYVHWVFLALGGILILIGVVSRLKDKD